MSESEFVRKVRALPLRERTILVLHTFNGISEASLAMAYGISEESVKLILAESRKRVGLEAEQDEDFRGPFGV